MTNPVTHVANTLVSDKWFQMLLTLVVIIAYVAMAISGNADGAEVFKNFAILTIGYWFGQMGSGVAIAQQVKAETIASEAVRNG